MKKSNLIPETNDQIAIFSVQTSYTSSRDNAMVQEYGELVSSDTFGKMRRRFSEDGGRSWSEAIPIFSPRTTSKGIERAGEGAFVLDENHGCLARFYNQHLYPGGTHTRDVIRLTTIRYEISKDGGHTFSDSAQLIVKGMTPERWAPGVEYGKNSVMISFSAPFLDRNKRIILPAQRFWMSADHLNTYQIPLEAGCLVGQWDETGKITWSLGEMVCVYSGLSSRGLFEPAIEELGDGRLLMICRGSNAELENAPGYKWKSVSYDSGFTWSKPEPFGYEDGALFYSPSSGSRLIRHSKNGRLYWIGNITSANPNGNTPRYPLQIAEVDESRLSLIRDSVLEIDNRHKGDTAKLQLSNFKAYEDRTTGEFVITLTRIFAKNTEGYGSPAWQYRISPE